MIPAPSIYWTKNPDVRMSTPASWMRKCVRNPIVYDDSQPYDSLETRNSQTLHGSMEQLMWPGSRVKQAIYKHILSTVRSKKMIASTPRFLRTSWWDTKTRRTVPVHHEQWATPKASQQQSTDDSFISFPVNLSATNHHMRSTHVNNLAIIVMELLSRRWLLWSQ